MDPKLRVFCSYQGGKQRIAREIVEHLLNASRGKDTRYYDLCCGSGAISIELVNRGISPSNIVMLDHSSWGNFWSSIGAGTFDIEFFSHLLSEIPDDKRKVKDHIRSIAAADVGSHEAEIYTILQASSFGGKQISYENGKWKNAFFRDFWEPTPTSTRRSPANPMQPSPEELGRRVNLLYQRMRGVTCFRDDIDSVSEMMIPEDAIVYVDPPYQATTGYAFNFEIDKFVTSFKEKRSNTLFVSEGSPLNSASIQLQVGGPNGGISGRRALKHQEWISRF